MDDNFRQMKLTILSVFWYLYSRLCPAIWKMLGALVCVAWPMEGYGIRRYGFSAAHWKPQKRSPDFRHKCPKEAFWTESWCNLPWVKAELAATTQGPAESIGFRDYGRRTESCQTLVGEFEYHLQRSTPGVNKKSSGTCGHVRTLCKAGRLKEALHILNQQGSQADSNTYVCALQECIKMKGLAEGKQVHAHIIQSGFKPNIFLLNTVVNMYAKCGSVVDAWQVFDKMPERDMFTWNIMIAGYGKQGYTMEALKIYEKMRREGVMPNRVTFICVLNVCASLAVLEKGKEVHADVMKAGIMQDVILDTAIVDMYAKCGSMKDACQVFDNMAQRDVVTWNAMIAGYAQCGCARESLDIYEQMTQEGVTPNKVTFICVLHACASLAALEKGKMIHADIIKIGIASYINLENTLVDMYAKCGSMMDAHQVFDNMALRDVVSWSAMIAGYAQHGCGREALNMYEQMTQEGVKPNQVTFICVLSACTSLAALEKGREVHADIMKSGVVSYLNLETALVDMYAKCGSMEDARQVFANISKQDAVSWSAIIAGYVQHGSGKEALEMYEHMVQKGVKPDQVTFISVLNACASTGALEKGKEVHTDILKAGIVPYVILENTLVDMYAKCGSMKDACRVFDYMVERDVVSWSAIIAGYAQHGCGREALELYGKMLRQGLMPDEITFIGVLNACASLAALEKGKEVHTAIIKSGIAPYINLQNTLVDMYAKCGSIKDARHMFDDMAEKDVVSWNTMIGGYAQHGFGREAVQLFEQMQQEGLNPDGITFICVLSACNRVGLVDEGHHYFNSMSRDQDLIPTSEHFGCMVDLLGRAGQLSKAEDFINKMPIKPGASVWGALLGACRIHGDVEQAERAAKCLLKCNPGDAGAYVLLSNIYAAAGRWDDKAKVRKMMEDRGVKKESGCSCIEFDNKVHTFVVGDKLHPQIKEIHAELERLSGQMKEVGYVPDTSFVLHDVEEEQKEVSLCHHSEKLAIAFGIMRTPPRTPIHVVKNLRVCGDCHTATKFISKIAERAIVVRDASFFHHFEDGVCSCGDYW